MPVRAAFAPAFQRRAPTAGLVHGLPPCAAAKWPPTIAWISVSARAEGVDVGFHQARARAASERGGRRALPQHRASGGSAAKALASASPCTPWPCAVEDEEDAPSVGEIGAHENRRGAVAGAAAAVDDEAALLERGHADGRARAAVDNLAETRGAVGAGLRVHQGGAGGEGELRARAEAGMGRDGRGRSITS